MSYRVQFFIPPTLLSRRQIAFQSIALPSLSGRRKDRGSGVASISCHSRLHQPPASPCRIALQLQYDGTDFHGWERKPDVKTVQSVVERSVSELYGRRICVHAASRTDAGAHALGQVVHFDAPFVLSDSAVRRGLNSRLPSTVRVTCSVPTVHSFDSRRSALGRTYRYTLTEVPPSVFTSAYTWHLDRSSFRKRNYLDIKAMDSAARSLISVAPRDLSAFRRSRADARHTNIIVHSASVCRVNQLVHVDVSANWFVYGMMRLLVASLVDVGRHRLSVNSFEAIVQNAERSKVLTAAPATGLCLTAVDYGSSSPFNVPVETPLHPCYMDLT